MDREQSKRNIEEAKRHKLLPEHTYFSTDTGSWPLITYIIRNKLMLNHDPFFHMMQELIGKVNEREMRCKWGKLINFKYVIEHSYG
jgi:hypothetical protein